MISKRGVLSGMLAIGSALALTACSGGSSGTTSVTSTPSPVATVSAAASETPATSAPDGPEISVTVKGRKVTPSPGRVEVPKGGVLTLNITVDHDDEVHLHGPDAELEVKAGVPGSVMAEYDTAGVYEVELHHPSLLLFQVVVR
ncbi:hypothetical protein ACIB24_06320 [Spongisporangium articulatum]|uniref:EfeO-type cupredoxin-like domain-containing protein n=1 Tax=Spongisporangium articulatum TaxID=3362603 RepID=A0ABW8AJX9_9ACTN